MLKCHTKTVRNKRWLFKYMVLIQFLANLDASTLKILGCFWSF